MAQQKSLDNILNFCHENNILAFNTLPILEQESGGAAIFRFEKDSHWTPLAHELVANQLVEYLSNGILNPVMR